MKFAINHNGADPLLDRFAAGVVNELKNKGHEITTSQNGAGFVLNLTDINSPKSYHRRSQAVFVVSMAISDSPVQDMRSMVYTTLVRTMSNLMICIVPQKSMNGSGFDDTAEIYFATPEVGYYHYPFNPQRVYESILPIVSSHLVIRNRLSTDLPPDYWQTSNVVESIRRFGRELDRMGLLPSPFPLRQVLRQKDIDHLYRLFEIKGLSYGNLSAREPVAELGESTFWMTARGVDKANLTTVGKDILLVKGYDKRTGEIEVSVPPDYHVKARVSVDAVEHELIYRTYKNVGAIIHVHAWMDGIKSTRQNYPCGTRELASEVVELLRRTENPQRAIIGLKNHGLTITGPDLDDIFARIRGRLKPSVPMFE